MGRRIALFVLGLVIISFLKSPVFSQQEQDMPYYFIAVHNEPFHLPQGRGMIEKSYSVLKEMIAKADEYNIRLTLMFSAQWADYITESAERLAELEGWKKRGHEIAAHHHSIYHGNWDGYTDYSKEEAVEQRSERGKMPEDYLGTLSDYIDRLKQINPGIKSGCLNDEADKKELPDEIIYDTCSGFANYGEPGRREGDGATAEKGRNDYITAGSCNGIEKKWLAHFQIAREGGVNRACEVIDSMSSGVYAGVVHSAPHEKESFFEFLEYLHAKDPQGKMSRTVSEIIEQKLIPEKAVSGDIINSRQQLPRACVKRGRCGDGICDELEKGNPMLCPGDCR